MPENSWERRHELTFALALRPGRMRVPHRRVWRQAEQRLTVLSSRAGKLVDIAAVACLQEELLHDPWPERPRH